MKAFHNIFKNLTSLSKSTNLISLRTGTYSFKNRCIHSSICKNIYDKDKTPEETYPTLKDYFDLSHFKNKETFIAAIEKYEEKNPSRRGHLEFIHFAVGNMLEFGVQRDLECYKELMDIFPKGKMIAKNVLQRDFWHFPRHQDCALNLLDQMEYYKVMPDKELNEMINNIFGVYSYVSRKMMRMRYWMAKFKNASPFRLPDVLPNDSLELAKIAINQICVDPKTRLSIFNSEDLKDSLDKTWLVSAQSPEQKQLIEEHPIDKPLYVEGSFFVWLRHASISYFMLRAQPTPVRIIEQDIDDVSNLKSDLFQDPSEIMVAPTIHEQSDGTILSLCATGTSSRDSLLSWIRFLQISNPKLSKIPVVFTLRAPAKELVTVNLDKIKWNEAETNVHTDEEITCIAGGAPPLLTESKT